MNDDSTELALSIVHGRMKSARDAASLRIALKDVDKYQHSFRDIDNDKQSLQKYKLTHFKKMFFNLRNNTKTISLNHCNKMFHLAYSYRKLWSNSTNDTFKVTLVQYLRKCIRLSRTTKIRIVKNNQYLKRKILSLINSNNVNIYKRLQSFD